MTRTIIGTAAAAILTLASAGAWADATASASLANLTFELVDLDPNDGITPWIQFASQSNALVQASASTATPSATSKTSATSSDGFGATQASSNAANLAGGSGAVSGSALTDLSLQSSAYVGAAGTANSATMVSLGNNGAYTTFTLSPETELIVTSTASMSATSSATSATEYGEAFVELSLGGANGAPTFVVDGVEAGERIFGTHSDSLTDTLQVSLTNDSATTETGTFLAIADSFAFSALPAVPEPASGTLFMTGLGALALALRRRR